MNTVYYGLRVLRNYYQGNKFGFFKNEFGIFFLGVY